MCTRISTQCSYHALILSRSNSALHTHGHQFNDAAVKLSLGGVAIQVSYYCIVQIGYLWAFQLSLLMSILNPLICQNDVYRSNDGLTFLFFCRVARPYPFRCQQYRYTSFWGETYARVLKVILTLIVGSSSPVALPWMRENANRIWVIISQRLMCGYDAENMVWMLYEPMLYE